MITKCVLSKYTFDGGGTESFVSAYEITNYLIDDDYVLDKRLEFKKGYEFMASSIDLRFIANSLFDAQFIKTNFTNNFYTIDLYLDNNVNSEFWGFILPETITENENYSNEWTLTAADATLHYLEQWSKENCPQIAGGSTTGFSTFESILTEIVGNKIISGTNVELNGLNNDIPNNYYNTHLVNDGKYYLNQFLEEARKHFGCYMFIGPDKKLNFWNRNIAMSDNSKSLTNNIIKAPRQVVEIPKYEAIIVSEFINGSDPDEPTGAADGLFVIKHGGGGDVAVEQVLPYGGTWDELERDTFRKYNNGILDLSQKWNDYSIQGGALPTYWYPIIFVLAYFQDRFDNYKNLLVPHEVLTAEVDNYDYDLLETVDHNSKDWIVNRVKKYTRSEKAELFCREKTI